MHLPRNFKEKNKDKMRNEYDDRTVVYNTLMEISSLNNHHRHISNNSQFSVFERADQDVVLLQCHVFMAVWRDDLVADRRDGSSDEEEERKNKRRGGSIFTG